MCPPITSVSAGAVPLYGTIVKSAFASYLIASSARWLAEPTAEVPNTYFFGSALMATRNSFRLFAGVPGYAVTSNGTEPRLVTGVKSFSTSYGT